jgi:TonB-dependent receptor-like protein
VLRLEGKTGDDHFRFSATNFLPGFEITQGFTPSNLTPRVNLSGPIRRGKAWWFEGIGAEYDFNINKDLPFHPNSTPVWRVNSLSRVQVNLTSSNVLSADVLLNQERSQRVGLAANTPVAATVDQNRFSYFAGVKDSLAISPRSLLEVGVGFVLFSDRSLPGGDFPYFLTPQGVNGSFFETTHSHSHRLQGFARFVRTTSDRKHELTFGSDVDGITYRQRFQRNPIFIIGQNGSLVHEITFTSPGAFTQHNTEVSLYAQDRWSVAKSLLVEYGLRGDWDSIIRDWTVQPRLAGTYVLSDTKTKFSAGIGLVTDQTSLNLLTQSSQGQRLDQDFGPDGVTPVAPPRRTAFITDLASLRTPRVLNWSVGMERMLPFDIYFKAEYQQKRGDGGYTFVNIDPRFASSGTYLLSSVEKNKYDAVAFTAQKKFATNHQVFLSYVRSAARSSAVVPFTLSNPLFGQQSGGPLPWDAPNHVVSWGWLPLSSKFDFAYSLDWRTGFPFLVVNQAQQAVLPANRTRFPAYMNLNLHIERRFHFRGREWALRLGVNNVTGRRNPASVNNNIDSPDFFTFSQDQHRALTARIRLIGRK